MGEELVCTACGGEIVKVVISGIRTKHGAIINVVQCPKCKTVGWISEGR